MTTPSKIMKSDIDKTFVDSLATVEYVDNIKLFNKLVVGSTTITADTLLDTVTIVAGPNVSLTADTTNNKIAFSATDTTYNAAGNSLGLVKSGGDVTISDGVITVNDNSHNHVISNIDGLQSTLDAKAMEGHVHSYDDTLSLESSNAVQNKTVTAAINTINSNITLLNNNKADWSHNHATSDITSGTLAVARGGTGITSNPSLLVNLGSTSAASVFATSPRPGVTGALPVANGGTGGTNAGYFLNMMGQGTYTVGVNTALDKTSWFEVARCPYNAWGLTQRTTLLVNGSGGHGMCILHIALRNDSGELKLSSCEMEMVAKTSKMSTGIFAVDTTTEPNTAILYVRLSFVGGAGWYNFKILHQQCFANYTTAGTDIVNLPNVWVFKANYGAPASANRKDNINITLSC